MAENKSVKSITARHKFHPDHLYFDYSHWLLVFFSGILLNLRQVNPTSLEFNRGVFFAIWSPFVRYLHRSLPLVRRPSRFKDRPPKPTDDVKHSTYCMQAASSPLNGSVAADSDPILGAGCASRKERRCCSTRRDGEAGGSVGSEKSVSEQEPCKAASVEAGLGGAKTGNCQSAERPMAGEAVLTGVGNATLICPLRSPWPPLSFRCKRLRTSI